MKKIFSLFALAIILFSIQSCNRLQDDNGDMLNDIDMTQDVLSSDRFLYREYNQGQKEKEYHYDQRKLVEVVRLMESAVVTLEYNGNTLDKVHYTKDDGTNNITYTRVYRYDEQKKVEKIREVKQITAEGQVTPTVHRSVYTISYDGSSKLKTILMKTGQEVTGQDFAFTGYSKADFVYQGNNIVQQNKIYGLMDGQELGEVVSETTYVYDRYDDKKTPFSLLPYRYRLSQLLDYEAEAYRFSENNTRKITVSSTQNPLPVSVTTLFTYDEEGYALLGYGKSYDYRPF
ncbi:MAG: hypothetical protein CSA38_03050 [Flavobacteriales bacterium]|nr:MAG: hypothetical protein CSA38_03050 [Flavobacteriales bacterium]